MIKDECQVSVMSYLVNATLLFSRIVVLYERHNAYSFRADCFFFPAIGKQL